MNPNTPVLIGTAQISNHVESLEDTREPLQLMLEATQQAAEDACVAHALDQVQSVRVIRGVWPYDNPAKWLAERIGAPAAQTVGTFFGGNYVQTVLNATCRSILAGDLELAVLTGAEIGNSHAKARRLGRDIPMHSAPGSYDLRFGADQQSEHHECEKALGIRQAIQIYPMYENALRYHRGESIAAHAIRVSELWARFNDVACGNPHAWIQRPISAAEIRTPSPTNRPISFPYTKFMNANMSVDMAAALIVCSVAKARHLGVPEHLWVYPHAGVEGNDHFSASVRDNFHTSPAIRIIGARVLALAGLTPAELDYVDLYSCFPSAVQIAATELGLDETRPLTVTGGLTFNGGPLNNYVMHAVARTVELLRQNPHATALVTANGGNLYKHAHVIYAKRPPAADFQYEHAQAEIDRLPSRDVLPEYRGHAQIESYTVMFSGDAPGVAHVAGRTPGGQRFWLNSRDPELLQAMTEEEFCGRALKVEGEKFNVTS